MKLAYICCVSPGTEKMQSLVNECLLSFEIFQERHTGVHFSLTCTIIQQDIVFKHINDSSEITITNLVK